VFPAWLVKLALRASRAFKAQKAFRVLKAFKVNRALALSTWARSLPKATFQLLPLRAISMLSRPPSQLGDLFGMIPRLHGKTLAQCKAHRVLLAPKAFKAFRASPGLLAPRAILSLAPLALRVKSDPLALPLSPLPLCLVA
jgi:hypothetical protein